MGASMLRVYAPLGLTVPALPDADLHRRLRDRVCALGIARLNDGLAAYLWAWPENQVLVAVKTVPLGQQAGQTMLPRAAPALCSKPSNIAAALRDDELGTAAIGFALRSARHETQYSRLFRS